MVSADGDPAPRGPRGDGWRERVDRVRRLAESVGLAMHSDLRQLDHWRLCREGADLVVGSIDAVEAYLRHEMLWDPTEIGSEVWREIGVDPTTLTCDIAGSARRMGFKRCGGREFSRAYAISVWSQLRTIEDFRRTQPSADFVAVTVAGRVGFRYRPRFDHGGDQYDLVFPTVDGSCSIEVLRLDHRSGTKPADRVLEVARVIVPLLPD